MDMAEYVVDANECDQQPYGERDKAKNIGSKLGYQVHEEGRHDRLAARNALWKGKVVQMIRL